MLPYFALLALPSALALAQVSRVSFLAAAVVIVVYTLFGGLRFEVGTDWFNYEFLHFNAEGQSLSEIFTNLDPFSMLLFKISQESGSNMAITNCFTAAALILGVVAYARRTPNPWIGVVVATPYLIIGFGMSGVRQAIGVGLTLLALSYWHDRKAIRRYGLIGLASLFHASALIAGLFLLLSLKLKRSVKILVLVPAIALTALLVQQLAVEPEAVTMYQDRYFGNSDADSSGSLFHIAFILGPAAMAILLRKRLFRYVEHPDLIWYGIIAAFALIPLNVISSTAASRLSLYLYFVPIAVYPALAVSLFRGARAPVTAGIVLSHFVILYLWLAFANNSQRHIPYQNVVF